MTASKLTVLIHRGPPYLRPNDELLCLPVFRSSKRWESSFHFRPFLSVRRLKTTACDCFQSAARNRLQSSIRNLGKVWSIDRANLLADRAKARKDRRYPLTAPKNWRNLPEDWRVLPRTRSNAQLFFYASLYFPFATGNRGAT